MDQGANNRIWAQGVTSPIRKWQGWENFGSHGKKCRLNCSYFSVMHFHFSSWNICYNRAVRKLVDGVEPCYGIV